MSLQEMEHIGIVTWLIVTLLIYLDCLCGQYTVTPDSQTTLTHGIGVNLLIFQPLNQV